VSVTGSIRYQVLPGMTREELMGGLAPDGYPAAMSDWWRPQPADGSAKRT
jgi:hypothetical protein